LSSSHNAQYVTLKKYFSHQNLVIYFSRITPIKVKLGASLIQQCVGAIGKSTFGNKPSRGSYKERHCHKSWFDANCRTTKCELKLWLKADLHSHATKHQTSKLKKLLKRKKKI
jgi:hypothetical protein